MGCVKGLKWLVATSQFRRVRARRTTHSHRRYSCSVGLCSNVHCKIIDLLDVPDGTPLLCHYDQWNKAVLWVAIVQTLLEPFGIVMTLPAVMASSSYQTSVGKFHWSKMIVIHTVRRYGYVNRPPEFPFPPLFCNAYFQSIPQHTI